MPPIKKLFSLIRDYKNNILTNKCKITLQIYFSSSILIKFEVLEESEEIGFDSFKFWCKESSILEETLYEKYDLDFAKIKKENETMKSEIINLKKKYSRFIHNNK